MNDCSQHKKKIMKYTNDQTKQFFDNILPEEEYRQIVSDRRLKIQRETAFFYQRLTMLDSKLPELSDQCKPYHVKFYDEKIPIVVRATNFATAAILAMASRIHSLKSWGVEYVENMEGVKVPITIT